MSRAIRSALTVCLLATGAMFAFAVSAQAANPVYLPPGNSVTDQYTEAFPWFGGDRTDRPTGGGPEERLGEQNTEEILDAAGDGGEIAAVLASTGPPVADAGSGSAEGSEGSVAGGEASTREGPDDSTRGQAGAAGKTAGEPAVGTAKALVADQGGGLGPVLWILIATALVGLLGLAAGAWRLQPRD